MLESSIPQGGRYGTGREFGKPWQKWQLYILILMVLVINSIKVVSGETGIHNYNSQSIVETFKDEPWQQFTHLTVDKNTGTLYVGGVNRIYQLDSNLHNLQSLTTGPILDSSECSPGGYTDNVNKLLVIDYSRSHLIMCGTIRQESCQVRDLQDIKVLIRNVSGPIVPSDAKDSTVAFIAEGPPKPPTTHVLYIGVTYTKRSLCMEALPAVASRSLEDKSLLDIAVTGITTSTRMYVNSLARERYRITYIYGFGSDKFSYFLTQQLMENWSRGFPFISKLVRVCQNDPDYYSYTEIPIVCKDPQGKNYNLAQAAYVGKPGADLAAQLGIQTNDDVLFAVFSQSQGDFDGSPIPADESALCVYSMKSVRRKFYENIIECFSGNGNRGLNFISPAYNCIPTRIYSSLTEDFCGMDVNTPLGGEQPVESSSLITFSSRLTAVASTSHENSTVVFLGTAQGHLKKVVIENENSAYEYDDIIIDADSPVKQDMHFNKGGDHLYVMTNNQISKVKVGLNDCGIYNTCNECSTSRNPFCGWCSLEDKCSLRKDCSNATQDPQYWFNYITGHQCVTITNVYPENIQFTAAFTLTLKIENFPPWIQGSLECVFSDINQDLVSIARRTAQGISCTTPRSDLLSKIPSNEHYITTKLSVRETGKTELATTNFTFFNCWTYKSCSECSSSPFPCSWCVEQARCTHNPYENCRNDILVYPITYPGPTTRKGSEFCGKITSIENQPIVVSSGTEKVIRVKAHNIPYFMTQAGLTCQVSILGVSMTVTAQMLNDVIYCGAMKFSYTSNIPSTKASFSVIWDGEKTLDNPEEIHVVVYDCQKINNCGMCLIAPEQYRCGWCQSTQKCELEHQCSGGSWLHRDNTCPNVHITNFYPKSGPWEGGTNITIEGINLGKTIDDIKEGITVAGIPCQPYPESYEKTKQISCFVNVTDVEEYKEGPIAVIVESQYRGESLESYRFVNPEILDFTPKQGPKSGGTLLHITGKHMDAGSHIEAFIDGLPCEIQSKNSTVVTCITPSSNLPLNGIIEMIFDDATRSLLGQNFTYVENPKNHSVDRPSQDTQLNYPSQSL